MPLFSGSGAVKIMDLYEDEPNDDYESYAMRQRMQPHGGQLMMTTQVTTKVPPGFDGKTSWFAFEDAIDDWCDITELEAEKWVDPHLEIALKARHLFTRDCLIEMS